MLFRPVNGLSWLMQKVCSCITTSQMVSFSVKFKKKKKKNLFWVIFILVKQILPDETNSRESFQNL